MFVMAYSLALSSQPESSENKARPLFYYSYG